jgi:hypothetical protein
VHLYEPNTVVRWRIAPSVGTGGGAQRFRGENPARAGQVFYSLAKKPERISLKIVDVAGQTVRDLQASNDVGLHHVSWDLTRAMGRRGRGGGSGRSSGAASSQPEGEQGESIQGARGRRGAVAAGRGGAGGSRGGRGGRGARGTPVPAGAYRVVLTVDGKEHSQTIRVEADPQLPAGVIPTVDEEVVTDPYHDRGREKVLIELGRSYLDD